MMKKYNLLLLLLLTVFVAHSQTIVNVSPGVANQGQTLQVTISGQNTHFDQGTMTSVWFDQGSSTIIMPNFTNANSATQLQGQFTFGYNHPVGWYNTTVYDQIDGLITSPNSFYLLAGANPPQIISVNPNSAMKGQLLTVTVSGQNTHFLQASYTLWFSQGSTTINPISTNLINNVEMEADFFFPYNKPLGFYNVNTYNPVDFNLVLQNGFTLLPNAASPLISQITPDTLQVGVAGTLTVIGTNTHFLAAGTNLAYVENGTNYGSFNQVTVVNDTVILLSGPYFSVPNGWYNVHITNNLDGDLMFNNAVYLFQTGVGIQENPVRIFQVYPNPFTENILIDIGAFPSDIRIRCFDVNGKTVSDQVIGNDRFPFHLNMKSQQSGIYFLELSGDQYSESHRIVKL